jgi:hypothetical protein
VNPQIGAALIAVGGAVIGACSVVTAVYATAARTRSQKRGELAASALSEYMNAAAKSVTASALRESATSLSDEDRREQVAKKALEAELEAREIGAHAKAVLLATADSSTLADFARWDKNAVGADPDQQRALLMVLNGIRQQVDGAAGIVPEQTGLGLMFGWSNSR